MFDHCRLRLTALPLLKIVILSGAKDLLSVGATPTLLPEK
jgi:hypothetical protein